MHRFNLRPDDAAELRSRAAALKTAINKLMFDETSGTFCDGVCSDTPHTAFHSAVYLLAFDAVAEEHTASTWEYIRSRIQPLETTSEPSSAITPNDDGWPPAPGPGAEEGMPCGTYVSQFVVQVRWSHAPSDRQCTLLPPPQCRAIHQR